MHTVEKLAELESLDLVHIEPGFEPEQACVAAALCLQDDALYAHKVHEGVLDQCLFAAAGSLTAVDPCLSLPRCFGCLLGERTA